MAYYVYELIDPRSDAIFYVGKGKGSRPSQHIRDARCGVQSAKCDLIREVLEAGMTVRVNIVKQFECEKEAYAFEAERISELGLENLTNVMPGGGGSLSDPLLENDKGHVALLVVLERTAIKYGIDAGVWLKGECIISVKERLEWSRKRFDEILARRGLDWVRKQLALRNVNLTVA